MIFSESIALKLSFMNITLNSYSSPSIPLILWIKPCFVFVIKFKKNNYHFFLSSIAWGSDMTILEICFFIVGSWIGYILYLAAINFHPFLSRYMNQADFLDCLCFWFILIGYISLMMMVYRVCFLNVDSTMIKREILFFIDEAWWISIIHLQISIV